MFSRNVSRAAHVRHRMSVHRESARRPADSPGTVWRCASTALRGLGQLLQVRAVHLTPMDSDAGWPIISIRLRIGGIHSCSQCTCMPVEFFYQFQRPFRTPIGPSAELVVVSKQVSVADGRSVAAPPLPKKVLLQHA